MADCTVPKVVMNKSHEADGRADALYPTIRPLLLQMKALAEKASDPKRAIGDQLSAADSEQFGEVRSRLLALQWRALVEGNYSKHMELIEMMAEAVDTDYRWGREPDEKSPDFLVDVTPGALQQISPMKNIDTPKEDHCTLIWALHLLEKPSLDALSQPNEVRAAQGQFSQLEQKYHVERLDRNALSTDDQRTFDAAQGTLVRLQREAKHVQQIEQIKTMVEAADIIYAASISDLEQSAGDPKSSINTLQQMKKDGRLSDEMAIRVGMWNKLDEKYPSMQATMMKETAKAMSGAASK